MEINKKIIKNDKKTIDNDNIILYNGIIKNDNKTIQEDKDMMNYDEMRRFARDLYYHPDNWTYEDLEDMQFQFELTDEETESIGEFLIELKEEEEETIKDIVNDIVEDEMLDDVDADFIRIQYNPYDNTVKKVMNAINKLRKENA